MRRYIAFFLFLVSAGLAAAQARHPFTFEDMMKLKRVGEPVVSPDGKWVIFSAVDVDLSANTKIPHIWLVPAAGGEEREIIAGQDADRPRWSPDGKRFVFTSTKEGGSQVWIADFDNAAGSVGSMTKLTTIASEASGEVWSPDGRNILFTSDVYAECDGPPVQENACNAKKLEEANASKVKAQIFTHLLYRHWNAYKEGKRSHIFVVPLQPSATEAASGARFSSNLQYNQAPRDLTPGDFDAPVFSLGGQDDYAFSPDGQEICYSSNHDKNPAASTNNDLWIVPIAGGPAKNITADNPASDSSPLYSPDGKYIAYRAQKRPGYESDRFQLMLYDRKTGEKKSLTAGFDRWIDSFIWSPDSKSILFTAQDKGESPIFSLQLSDRKIQGIVRGFNGDLSLSADGKSLFYTRVSFRYPTEIFVQPVKLDNRNFLDFMMANCYNPSGPGVEEENRSCDGSSDGAIRLTHLNDAVLSATAMSPMKAFSFSGANNEKVQGFLIPPPDFDASKKYPLKFVIHGGPEVPLGDEWSYRWNGELFAASGYVVIEINFHGSPGYGQKFIDAINGDWGGAPYEDLMKGLDYAETTYPFIDKARECALGASYGGYMINWMLGHTDRFKCLGQKKSSEN